MKTYAIIKDGVVENIVCAEDAKFIQSKNLLEITGTINNEHVDIGWVVENNQFIQPTKAANNPSIDLNSEMWKQFSEKKALAKLLVELGVLKSDPTEIGVTKL
jgi:hypothetical protein